MRASALVLLLLAAACQDGDLPTEPSSPTPAPASASLSGTVFSYPDDTPVVDAAVALSSGGARRETTTDASGSFAISELAPGRWELTISIAGATLVEQSVDLVAGPNRLDIRLPGVNSLVPYGTVRDARSGAPIAGATVAIWTGQATTDERGDWRIDFGPGPHSGSTITIEVSKPGYQTHRALERASALCTCRMDFSLQGL